MFKFHTRNHIENFYPKESSIFSKILELYNGKIFKKRSIQVFGKNEEAQHNISQYNALESTLPSKSMRIFVHM